MAIRGLGTRWRSAIALVSATAALGCGAAQPDMASDEGATAQTGEAIALTPADLCEYTVYSSQGTDIRDRSTSSTGFVGSGATVTLGADARVTGHVRSTGSSLLRSRANVNGNVTAGGTVTLNAGASVTGTITQNTSVPAQTIPTKSVTFGTADVNLLGGQTGSPAPGNYRDIHAFAGSTLRLRAGTYNVRSFILEASSVHIVMDVSGGPININVQNELRFGNGMKMDLVGSTNPRLVNYYSNWTNQLTIGTDLTLYGVVTAPNANIVAGSRAAVRGSLFGKRVTMDTDDSIRGACECGNGFLDANEECDDGNTVDTDGCTNKCKTARCGDGVVHLGFEECDDGNVDGTDACTNSCTVARCGDGVVQAGVEECDDGNTNDLDSCTNPVVGPCTTDDCGCVFRPLRKNVALIPASERNALIAAMRALDGLFYSDGVSYWDKQDQIHEVTHVHGEANFLPWHRELLNRYERLLRKVDPTVALHYWDWTTDPINGPVNLFTASTFGSGSGRAGFPFDFDSNGGSVPYRPTFASSAADFLLPIYEISRNVTCDGTGFMSDAATVDVSGLTQGQEWNAVRSRIDSGHAGGHFCVGGTLIDPHSSFEDPFVYIMHSNVDRIWALYQTSPGKAYRVDPTQAYGEAATDPSTAPELSSELDPWNGDPHLCPWGPAPCPIAPWDPANPDPSDPVVHKTSFATNVVRPPLYESNGTL